MRLVASPGFVTACAVLLAVCLHPALPIAPPPAVTAALALLLVVGLFAGARRAGGRIVGLGALAVAAALGYDGLRGHHGTLTLEAGSGTNRYEEEGPDGQPLGLRPLGFDLVAEKIEPGGAVLLRSGADARLVVGRGRSASQGGLRIGLADTVPGAEPSVLRISVAGPQGSRLVDVAANAPATVDGLEIGLERYFPDFALDAKQQPYSRSNEPRNPAALLGVRRGSASWRVFVIRAMPGIHKPEGLDRVLSLTEVVPREVVTLRVSREPAAALALGGLLLMAAGAALEARPA